MNPLSRKLLIATGAGIALAMPTGMMLGNFTTSNMRRDFAYGYEVPDPQAIAAARDDSDDGTGYEPAQPKQFGQDAVFHAKVNGDEAASYESVYFPDGSPEG